MRTHRWLKALAFGCCLGAGADAAFAQAPFMGGGGGSWTTADGTPVPAQYAPQMPGTFQAPFATNDPSVLYPQGTPPSYAPWPQVSPYHMGNYAEDLHYNQGGTWFRQILNKNRDYYFNVNVLNTITRGPGGQLIGAKPIDIDPVTFGPAGYPLPNYGDAPTPSTGGGTGNTGGTGTIPPLSQVNVDKGVYPFPYMRTSPTSVPTITTDRLNANIFPIRSTSMFSEFRSPGLQLEWGFEDEDGSGFKADAWWGFSSDQTFQRGQDTINGVPIDQELIILTEGQFLFTRNGAVTWDTGIPLVTIPNDQQTPYGAVVGTQKYDVMYKASVQSQAGGGDLQMVMPDLFPTTSAIRLRPVYGAKYTYIGETFDFRGIDSGLSYELGTATGGGGTGGQTGTSFTFRPDPWGAAGPDAIDSDMFEAQMHSRVRTHLAGPLGGFRYDFGRSRNFKLWGQSSVGLLANYEDVRIQGFNAGENLVTRFLLGVNMLDGDSRFSDSETHAHVSPVFEQTFMSESKILAALPLTREVPILANANFRVGYTATLIGQVARPASSIQWNGFPKTPTVDIEYQTFSVGRLNFGLEWTY